MNKWQCHIVRVLIGDPNEGGTFIGTAFFINDCYLLTAKHVVENHISYGVFLDGVPDGSKPKIKSDSILLVNDEIDIALLKTNQPFEKFSTRLIPWNKEINTGKTVTLLGFIDKAQSLNEIESKITGHAGVEHCWRTQASINKGMSGSPAFIDNQLAGMVIIRDVDTKSGYFLPIDVIKRFLCKIELEHEFFNEYQDCQDINNGLFIHLRNYLKDYFSQPELGHLSLVSIANNLKLVNPDSHSTEDLCSKISSQCLEYQEKTIQFFVKDFRQLFLKPPVTKEVATKILQIIYPSLLPQHIINDFQYAFDLRKNDSHHNPSYLVSNVTEIETAEMMVRKASCSDPYWDIVTAHSITGENQEQEIVEHIISNIKTMEIFDSIDDQNWIRENLKEHVEMLLEKLIIIIATAQASDPPATVIKALYDELPNNGIAFVLNSRIEHYSNQDGLTFINLESFDEKSYINYYIACKNLIKKQLEV